jgi:3-hydroxyacyl-CoA dehydrogenase
MAISVERFENILVATVDNPPVNALSGVERQGLIDAVLTGSSLGIEALIIAGARDTFIAGADIREFGQPLAPPYLPDVVATIEGAPFPVVAAIAGQALGGGLEIALGCHYRLATPRAKLGLPEVTLGLVPGAGGTQRLPRLIGAVAAGEMITTGKSVPASAALLSGLIDQIVEGDLLEAALGFARQIANQDVTLRRLSHQQTPAADIDAMAKLEAATRKASRGARAPLVAFDLVRASLTLAFEEGMREERRCFLELRDSDQARALRHIFFAEREAAKHPVDCADASARPCENIGIVGAGTMGTGIAMSVADAGISVTIVELSADALERGLARIADSYASAVARGRLSQIVADARISAIRGTTSYADLSQCDLIIEAAFETMEVKRSVFAALDAIAKPGAILASNTSYLDLDEIARCTTRPGDVVGLHYFSPANVMRLLEIVRGAVTKPDVLKSALLFAKRTGKQPVIAGVCNGFIGNRMLRAYTRQAGLLILEGARPKQIDKALTEFGMAMGPFAVVDLAGIDIGYKARQGMAPGSFDPMAVILHNKLVERGDLGRKTGRGFYVYDDAAQAGTENPVVGAMIDAARRSFSIIPRTIDEAEIVERCMTALAEEGAAIVEEGIAARSGDIDVVYVHGYGFPRYLGGPMYHGKNHPSPPEKLSAK